MMRIVYGLAAILLLASNCADYELLDDDNKRIDAVTLAVDTVTDSSVTLRWSRYRENDFSYYVVLYGTGDIIDWNDKVADSLMFDFDTVKIVKPLDGKTRYYFRVMVLSDDGIFSGSNTVDTMTSENMHGKLTASVSSRDSSGNYLLRWSRAIDEYDRYRLYADTTNDVDTADTLFATVYSDTVYRVDDELFGKTFWVRVYAFNDTVIVAKSNTLELKKD